MVNFQKKKMKKVDDRLAEIAAREQEERTEYLGRQINPDNTSRNRTDQGEEILKASLKIMPREWVINENNYNLAVRLYNVRIILKKFQEF